MILLFFFIRASISVGLSLQSSDFNKLHWWLDLKTSLILLLQDEQKQKVKEARSKMKDLQERYRNVASSWLITSNGKNIYIPIKQ